MNDIHTDIYGGEDPRDLPAYSIGQAAGYLRMAPATLRSWVVGRQYSTSRGTARFRPLIPLPDPGQNLLSFWNIVEVHVLRALRVKHRVPMNAVRKAIDYAEKTHDIDRLLLSERLLTATGELFIKEYSRLINIARSGQLAMSALLREYLRRIEWDSTDSLPRALYPFSDMPAPEDSRIVIDPYVAFGRPVVQPVGITTSAIAGRIDAGDSPEDVAADYGIDKNVIDRALVYEAAA